MNGEEDKDGGVKGREDKDKRGVRGGGRGWEAYGISEYNSARSRVLHSPTINSVFNTARTTCIQQWWVRSKHTCNLNYTYFKHIKENIHK